MRFPAVAFLALASLSLAACGNPCQDLGDRICSCTGGGTSADTCRQQIKNLLSDAGMDATDEAFCSERLDACNVPTAPAGQPEILFCEWINTAGGKVACGLANPSARAPAPAASFAPATP
ncbi:MAG: hypothetical protein IPO09_01115 [Anaeromyxobacter sp.]|nr:hypothetical protein [Anaeromyxobacter sp.]MBL0278234.1 hypothetical protein [Anaeromyxobacter sp.]